jgi:DNA-binding MarR family transcriptional regulator
MAALAWTCAVNHQHIHQSLRRPPLEGWIDEHEDSEGRRSVLIVLNAKGREAWKRAQAMEETFFASISSGFIQEEIQRAHRVLRKLRADLSARTESR